MEFRLGELFCGPGGLALGAKNAEIYNNNGERFYVTHAFANDLDKSSCETFANNICPDNKEAVIHADVKTLNIESLPDIDALGFGFPCNDFSIVGEQKGFEGDYGGLYSYGLKVIEAKNPRWFIAENVGGLKSANGGKAFKKIIKDLKNACSGYNLTAHLYKFEEYGVPQTRHRIIIVGINERENLKFKVPAPTSKDNPKTAKQALTEPPISSAASNNEATHQSKNVIERLKHIPEGENAWYSGIPEHLQLNVKGAKLSQIYKRLVANKPSYTITGSGGGGTHGYHWEENRALTNRERARIQTFPDSFVFEGKKEAVRKQIGMAIPPTGAQIIIEAILKTFADIEYQAVEPKWNTDEPY